MTQETTAASTIARLESRLKTLQDNALFTRDRDRLAETDALLAALPGRVARLRSRNYVYHRQLEEQISGLAQRWPAAQRLATGNLQLQANALRADVAEAVQAVGRLTNLKTRPLSTAQPTIDRVDSVLDAAERKVAATQKTIAAAYEPLQDEAQAIEREVKACERNLDWLDGATFGLNAGECLVDATQARQIEGNDETEGILFLTDQRLLFERREKEARKKILFITTASELVKELRWESPLTELETVEAGESRKLLSKKEELKLVPASGARALPAQFRLETDSDAWRALMLRAKSGEIDAARDETAPVVQEYVVPAKCPTCGGAQGRAGRIRGATAIRCEYCGASIVLEKAS
ncbi:MAG: hypothetical protein R6X16_05870 [Anaerolineae bacterium]